MDEFSWVPRYTSMDIPDTYIDLKHAGVINSVDAFAHMGLLPDLASLTYV